MKTNNNSSSSKNNKKTLRAPKAEREKARRQKAAAEQSQKDLAIQETDKACSAFKALQTVDRKSAEHTYNAGAALRALKHDKLYRSLSSDDKKSFKEFVGEKFNISEQYAYMLINAACVQDVLTNAAVAPEYVPEKLLRKLTFLRKTEEGHAKIVEIWKSATGNDPKSIPSDKALADAVAASKSKSQPSVAKNRSDSEILNDPATDAGEIICILRKLTTGKTHLDGDDLSMLKDRLSAICDEAANKDNNN